MIMYYIDISPMDIYILYISHIYYIDINILWDALECESYVIFVAHVQMNDVSQSGQ